MKWRNETNKKQLEFNFFSMTFSVNIRKNKSRKLIKRDIQTILLLSLDKWSLFNQK